MKQKILDYFLYTGLVVAVLFSLSTLLETYVQHRMKEQIQYTRELEKTLANCLTQGDNPLKIGDELAFCGVSMTGIKL